MFIQVGIKHVQRRVGLIEDFCPICRSLQSADVFEVKQVTQVYFVPVDTRGTGKFSTKCTECKTEIEHNGNPLHQLDADDFDAAPGNIPRAEGATQRAKLEEIVQSGAIEPTMREYLLREPFVALAVMSQDKLKNSILNVGMFSLIIVLFVIIGSMTYLGLTSGLKMPAAKVLPWVIGVSSALVFIFALSMALTARNVVQKRLRPLLSRSLQPLQPSLDELQTILDELKAQKLMIGKAVKAEELCGDIMALDELALRR